MKEVRLVLEDNIHAQIKEKARKENRSIKAVFNELIDNYLEDKWGTLLREDVKVVDRLVSRLRRIHHGE